MKLIEKLIEVNKPLKGAIAKAVANKKEFEGYKKALQKFDVLGVGKTPKINFNVRDEEGLNSLIPLGGDAQHSWANLDYSIVQGEFAIVRDGKLKIVEWRHLDGFYSNNGTITDEWSYRWYDNLEVGDVIVALTIEEKGVSFGTPFESENYYIFAHPIIYGVKKVELVKTQLKEFEALFR